MNYPFPNRISGTSGERQVNPIGGKTMHPDQQIKETGMSQAIGTLYQSIEGLEGRVQLLVARLNSVLLSKPKCCEEKKDNALPQCELAKSIRGAVARIDKIQSIVNDTIDDLEI